MSQPNTGEPKPVKLPANVKSMIGDPNQYGRRMSKINRAFVDNYFDKYDYEATKNKKLTEEDKKLTEEDKKLTEEDKELITRFKPLFQIFQNQLAQAQVIERLAEQRGEKRGKQEGKKEGTEEGKKEGIEEGKKKGIEEGKKEGIEEGKKEGIEEGKKKGIEEGKQLVVENLLRFTFCLSDNTWSDEKLSDTILSLLALQPKEFTSSLVKLLKESNPDQPIAKLPELNS